MSNGHSSSFFPKRSAEVTERKVTSTESKLSPHSFSEHEEIAKKYTITEGQKLLINGLIEEAEVLFKYIEAHSPGSEECRHSKFYIGYIYFIRREFENAEGVFKELLPEVPPAHISYLQSMLCQNTVEKDNEVIKELEELDKKKNTEKADSHEAEDADKSESEKNRLYTELQCNIIRTFLRNKNLREDLEELSKKFSEVESVVRNDLFFTIAMIAARRKEYDLSGEYFKKMSLVYCRIVNSFELEYMPIKKVDADHYAYQYYLQKAYNEYELQRYDECIKWCCIGKRYYPNFVIFDLPLLQSIRKLLIHHSDGEPEAYNQLIKIIDSGNFVKVIEIQSEKEQYELCRDIMEYLENQACYYQLQKLLDQLGKSNKPTINALREEIRGDCASFYEDVQEALGHYKDARKFYYDSSTNSCKVEHKVACSIKHYMVNLISAEDKELNGIKEEIMRAYVGAKDIKTNAGEADKLLLSLLDLNSVKSRSKNKSSDKQLQKSKDIQDPTNFREFENSVSAICKDDAKDVVNKTDLQKRKPIWLEMQGVILFHKKEYIKSLDYFEHLIRSYPEHFSMPRWKIYKGRVYAAQRNYSDVDQIIKELLGRKIPLQSKIDIRFIQLRYKIDLEKITSEGYQQVSQLNKDASDYPVVRKFYRTVESNYLKQLVQAVTSQVLIHMRSIMDEKNVSSCQTAIFDNLFGCCSTVTQFKDLLLSEDFNLERLEFDYKRLAQMISKNKNSEIKASSKSSPAFFKKDPIEFVIFEWCNQLVSTRSVCVDSLYSKLSRETKLSPQREYCYDRLQCYLAEAFELSRVIARDDAQLPHTTTTMVFESAETGAVAVGLFPGLGKASAGITVGLKLFKMATCCLQKRNDKIAAERIARLVPSIRHISIISESIAMTICVMFKEQLDRLTYRGIDTFNEFVVALMLNYVSSDRGRESSVLKQVVDSASDTFKQIYSSILRVVDKSLAPKKENEQTGIATLLSGLFCCDLPKEGTRVEKTDTVDDVHNPWYVEGILMRAGVITANGIKYHRRADGDAGKYGYIYVNEDFSEMAESLGYVRSESQKVADKGQEMNCTIM